MKKLMNANFKPLFSVSLMLTIALAAHAQDNAKPKPVKLPETQVESMRAPDNIKIDGKTTEWDDKFQAKNPIDRINYTISNDDKNLYLTIRAQGAYPGAKIVAGGLTFTISHSVEKKKREKEPGNVSVTFPLTNSMKAASINAKHYHYWNDLAGNVVKHKGAIDSLHEAIDAQIGEACKEIVVTGIKDMDTLSVYNAEGIKAVIRFSDTFICVFEMAIPLKYLGLSTDSPEKFSYNIKISAIRQPQSTRTGAHVIDIRQSSFGSGNMDAPMMPMMMGPPDRDMVYLHDDTDFWAEYTLAKK